MVNSVFSQLRTILEPLHLNALFMHKAKARKVLTFYRAIV